MAQAKFSLIAVNSVCLKDSGNGPMPYRKPTADKIADSVWLDQALALTPTPDFVLEIAMRIAAEQGANKPRKDLVDSLTRAANVLVANLYYHHALSPNRFICIPRSNKAYGKGPHNPNQLNARRVRDVVNFLSSGDAPLIELRGGNYVRDKGYGNVTRARPQKSLVDYVHDYIIESINNDLTTKQEPPVTRNTLLNSLVSPIYYKYICRETIPHIILRDKKDGQQKAPRYHLKRMPKSLEWNVTLRQ